jgi:glycosyltransferase involved in cell wall biosynthesis
MRVALIHDWLTGMRGGERCLEQLCLMFPEADIYTLFHFPGTVSAAIASHNIHHSSLQGFPFSKRHYRSYLPLFPRAIEQFKLENYELIISTSHCVAKGIIPNPEAVHISYCFTPMRYIWDRRFDYFENAGRIKKAVISSFLHYLRIWDAASNSRVAHFVAISNYVKQRIKVYYARDAAVIYPPVDVSRFRTEQASGGDYYLLVSAFAPYKRIEQAIAAFNRLGRRLLIVGSGQQEKQLKAMAGKSIEFSGWVSDAQLPSLYARCQALIFPGIEDFGLVPVEVQASGRPVIAYGGGGVLESVIPYENSENPGTGMFYYDATPDGLAAAVKGYEKIQDHFDSEKIRAHAMKFDTHYFSEAFQNLVAQYMDGSGAS